MNFCEKSDTYISLYIDEQLEKKEKEEFEEHLKKCTQCAQKLKEESYFVQLCKDDEDIILPEGFSESLHKRLMEISIEENNTTSETVDKKKPFFLNRKLMASLSTAAVIVLSLLAYNLLPKMGSSLEKTSSVYDRATMQTAENEDDRAGIVSNETIDGDNKESAAAGNDINEFAGTANNNGIDINSTFSDSREGNSGEASDIGRQKAAKSKVNNTAGIKENNTEKNSKQAEDKIKLKVDTSMGQPAEESVSFGSSAQSVDSSNELDRVYDMEDDQVMMGLAIPEESTENAQYFTNYVEMTVTVEYGEAEMENLSKLMTEYGASVQSSGVVQGYVANLKEDTAYMEYTISLSDYAAMQTEARLKYKLELKAKTDIIKKDITEEYYALENKLKELDIKINRALSNGEDISNLETEKSNLIEQLNAIISRQEMITIRFFFVRK